MNGGDFLCNLQQIIDQATVASHTAATGYSH